MFREPSQMDFDKFYVAIFRISLKFEAAFIFTLIVENVHTL